MATTSTPLLYYDLEKLCTNFPLLEEALAPLNPTHPYLLGISGGADSVALLDLLLHWGYTQPILCHLHHHLRGEEADKDAHFISELGKKYQLLVEIGHADIKVVAQTKKCSLELAAREARYHFFGKVAQQYHCQQLLLAHHRDDQLETFLFRLFRGSSSRGLRSILPDTTQEIKMLSEKSSDKLLQLQLLRPLLSFSRQELRNYLTHYQLNWREDESNQELQATRNKIRHRLLPLLHTIFGTSCEEALLRRITLLREEEDFLAASTPPLSRQEKLPVSELRSLPKALQRRVIYEWLLYHQVPEPGFQEVTMILGLLTKTSPAKINLPGKRYARRRSRVIFLEPH